MKIKPKMVVGTEFLSRRRYNLDYLEKYFSLALSKKFNEIDTAYSYGTNCYVEKTLGKILNYKRKKFVISTKFLYINKNGRTIPIKTLDDIKYSLNSSLSNLRTDYIDNYYFHSGSNSQFFNDKIWYYLNNLKSQGVIKHLGLSIKNKLVLTNSLEQIDKSQDYGINKIQFVFNMLSDYAKVSLIPKLDKMNVQILGRIPYAKGYLVNNYIFRNTIKDIKKIFPEKIMYDKALLIKKKYRSLTKKDNINYCLKHVHKVVLASSNINQLKENIEYFNQYD